MPKVSVIIPIHNTEKYLRQCLDSVINQTLKDIEIICINDGSTDNSLNVLEEYASKDNRIKIINQKNQGVSSARNGGLDEISGEYYTFVDSDDWIDITMLEKMYNKITEDESDLAICRYYDHYKSADIEYCFPLHIVNLPPFYFNECHNDFFYNPTGVSFKLYKNNIKLQYFNKNLKFGEDAVRYWTYCLTNNPKISVINEALYYYRQHDNNTMRDKALIFNNELMNSIKYLIEQECFKNASECVRARILDRFLQSYDYQMEVTLSGIDIPNHYIKSLKSLLKYISKFDKNIVSELRYYKSMQKRIRRLSLFNKLIKNIFSLNNMDCYKIITILGIKIKIKTKFNEPVDMVYLWCDGNDPEFKKQKFELQKKLGIKVSPEVMLDCRYIDNDELKYSLRSLVKFANWINKIYVVTNGQCPKWLNTDNPRIKIINHEEIMPHDALPNYNSSAIELCIKNIPHLSEHFLYGNDDFFFSDYITPDFFFRKNKAIYRFMETYKNNDYHKDLYVGFLKNAENMIFKTFKKRYNCLPHHNIDPFIKSDMEKCYKKFQKEIDKTISHQFRINTDIQKSIYANYTLATNKGIFVDVTKQKCEKDSLYADSYNKEILWDIIKYRPKLLCINDTEAATDKDRLRTKEILKCLFPHKSEFENYNDIDK